MAAEEYLARDFKFSVAVPAETPTYVEVGGITSWSWTEEGTDTDVTDFDDAGWENSIIASIKAGLSLDVNSLVDPDTGAPDPGQKILDSAARTPGVRGYVLFKVEPRDPALSGAIQGRVTVKRGEKGGGNNDKLSHSYALTFKGKPTLTGMFDPDAVSP